MSRASQTSKRRPVPWSVFAAAIIACSALALALWSVFGERLWVPTGNSTVLEERDPRLDDALTAFERGQFERTEQLCRDILDEIDDGSPQPTILLLAGKAAAGRGRMQSAVEYWDRVGVSAEATLPADDRAAAAEAAYLSGRVHLYDLHKAIDAEERFRLALQFDDDAAAAMHELAHLLAVEARRTEAVPLIVRLIARNHIDVDQLALLGMPLGTINEPDLLKACYLNNRLNPAMLLGAAASTTFAVPPEQARILLEEAVRERPELVDAQVRLGHLLADTGDQSAFVSWHDALPDKADEHAEVWALRGAYAKLRGEQETAMRCYWETLRRDPNHRAALFQLSQLLIAAGRTAEASPLLARNQELQELRQRQDVLFYTEQVSLEPTRAVAEQFEKLGRPYEAWGWCHLALQRAPEAAWALEMVQQLEPVLSEMPPQTLVAFNPVRDLDMSDYPLPQWELESASPAPEKVANGTQDAIRLVEEGPSVGLDFTYFADARPAAEGKRMYEFPGGGVAILDFDQDGHPDACLTQGRRFSSNDSQRDHLDRLFRNLDGERFVDTTDKARLVEPGYSHGATVGDFDNDGFADLYIANIGENRLFRNNGDGTFSDISHLIEGDQRKWTTSCLVADLNGDALPDLYDVNYVAADDVFERLCQHPDGTPRMCMPFHFPGDQDQIYVNLGNGRFADVTREAGIEAVNGKGLGIVAGDFDGSGRLSLLIANDTTPNFYFANKVARRPNDETRTIDAASNAWFSEQGVASGLAFNSDGRAEGCMGIAAGDVDQDGRIDLFITNFLRETNTLYRQQEGAVFVDATVDFGLSRPSVDLLGFGTQLFDADLDGDLDLVVTNGHVDDVRAYGRPYQMRPQLFENTGKGSFLELAAASLGEYFSGEYLGRGLARCDWNGDGREDIFISHLDGPTALLTNRSAGDRHFLSVQLRGTTSSRDAIGTVVTARVGERIIVRQLTAGDGYQASNQRSLLFGLADSAVVDELEIRWPSGKRTVTNRIPADQRLLFVEGMPEGVVRESR